MSIMVQNKGFKIGDWVFRFSDSLNDDYHFYGKVFKITGFRKGHATDEKDVGHRLDSIRLATTEEINRSKKTQKQETMSTTTAKSKKAYHTFELDGRKVTIGVLGLENDEWALVGYSVCHPDDNFDEKLARKISIGRAESENRLGDHVICPELTLDYGVLKSIAHRYERYIKADPTIVGIYAKKQQK